MNKSVKSMECCVTAIDLARTSVWLLSTGTVSVGSVRIFVFEQLV